MVATKASSVGLLLIFLAASSMAAPTASATHLTSCSFTVSIAAAPSTSCSGSFICPNVAWCRHDLRVTVTSNVGVVSGSLHSNLGQASCGPSVGSCSDTTIAIHYANGSGFTCNAQAIVQGLYVPATAGQTVTVTCEAVLIWG